MKNIHIYIICCYLVFMLMSFIGIPRLVSSNDDLCLLCGLTWILICLFNTVYILNKYGKMVFDYFYSKGE